MDLQLDVSNRFQIRFHRCVRNRISRRVETWKKKHRDSEPFCSESFLRSRVFFSAIDIVLFRVKPSLKELLWSYERDFFWACYGQLVRRTWDRACPIHRQIYAWHYTYMVFAGRDRGLENAARGRRPRAAFSSPRSEFFTIRTDSKPVNSSQMKKKNHGKKVTQALLWPWSEIG